MSNDMGRENNRNQTIFVSSQFCRREQWFCRKGLKRVRGYSSAGQFPGRSRLNWPEADKLAWNFGLEKTGQLTGLASSKQASSETGQFWNRPVLKQASSKQASSKQASSKQASSDTGQFRYKPVPHFFQMAANFREIMILGHQQNVGLWPPYRYKGFLNRFL